MHWFKLPDAPSDAGPALKSPQEAKGWLANQAPAPPKTQLEAVTRQIEAIDGAGLSPALAIELLDFLRRTAIPAQAALEPRFLRKPLPLLKEERDSLDAVLAFWNRLGVAYLRLAPHFGMAEKGLPLHRAAIAFRMAQFCHYQSCLACPPQLDQLLFAVLAQADSSDLLRQPLVDPEFPHLGEANIAGLLAWAFLLRLIDPYRLSAAQLTVANRALSRWRELCGFQAEPDPDPKAHAIDLAPMFHGPMPEGIPRWLNVRSVIRKIHSRTEALKAGESPEALKLGKELSASAGILLLSDMERYLRSQPAQAETLVGDIELAFGAEHAFSIFTGEPLNPSIAMDASSTAIAHQRMALFGFNSVTQLSHAVQRVDIPSETWHHGGDQTWRVAPDGPRLLAPCLIATIQDDVPRLGVLSRLLCHADDKLSATLSWYGESIEACTLQRPAAQAQAPAPRTPAFLLHDRGEISLIVPMSAALRLDIGQALEGGSVEHLVPTRVLERGSDFIRYAYRLT